MKIEDRVAARLKADQGTAAKRVTALSKGLAGELTALKKCGDKLAQAVVAVEEVPNAARRDAAVAAHKAQGKALNGYLRANAALAEAEQAVVTLGSAKEAARRLKSAKSVQGKRTDDGGEVLSGPAAAEVVLLSEGRPMHYTEITRIALETGVVKLRGLTPEATMSAYLAKAVNAGDTFVRVDSGVFDLKARVESEA